MTLTLQQLNAASQAEFTALLDGTYEHSPWIAEAALGEAPVRQPGAAEAARWCRCCATPARDAQLDADPRPPGTGRQGDGQQDADRRVDQRAGQGRPDRLHAGRVRAASSSSMPTTTPSSASRSSWRCAGRAARAWTRREIIATFERRLDNHPDFELAECLRNIHRIAEIRLDDKFGHRARARQPGVGLGRAPGRRTATRATPSAASSPSPT